ELRRSDLVLLNRLLDFVSEVKKQKAVEGERQHADDDQDPLRLLEFFSSGSLGQTPKRLHDRSFGGLVRIVCFHDRAPQARERVSQCKLDLAEFATDAMTD